MPNAAKFSTSHTYSNPLAPDPLFDNSNLNNNMLNDSNNIIQQDDQQDDRYSQLSQHIDSIRSIFESLITTTNNPMPRYTVVQLL